MLQISMAHEYLLAPRRISGALYHKVTTSCVYTLTGIPNALPSPKSATLINPDLSINKFCGFRSR